MSEIRAAQTRLAEHSCNFPGDAPNKTVLGLADRHEALSSWRFTVKHPGKYTGSRINHRDMETPELMQNFASGAA